MGRKAGVIFLILTLFLILSGCSGGTHVISTGKIESAKNSIIGEYGSFTGKYFKRVKLKENENFIIFFSEETESGSLVAKVIDSNGKTLNTLKNGDSYKLNKPGKYKLQVEGEKHRGKFILTWE